MNNDECDEFMTDSIREAEEEEAAKAQGKAVSLTDQIKKLEQES
jgi:hypothetical protein